MRQELGYQKKLHILAFDQRSSFTKKMFGIAGKPTSEQAQTIAGYKDLIYAAFQRGLQKGVLAEEAGLLVDEEFGDRILRDARSKNYTFLLPTEKSGQEELDFEYGDKMEQHVEKYKPTFVKVLLRYNPEGDKDLNSKQVEKLKKLTEFSKDSGYKFLIETLIPATEAQLRRVNGESSRYDLEIRPALEVEMVRQIQAGGGEPDVWKIEGMEKAEEYRALSEQARVGNRNHVGIIVLGRHAPDDQVERWLSAGAQAPGVIGFAIGRTIFWEPLLGVKAGTVSRDEAVEQMADKYSHFYKFFNEAKRAQN